MDICKMLRSFAKEGLRLSFEGGPYPGTVTVIVEKPDKNIKVKQTLLMEDFDVFIPVEEHLKNTINHCVNQIVGYKE